jgi:hypothetical protein
MNLRGRYGAGDYVVTAKHWWSPRERRSARLAAKVLAYESSKIRGEVRDRMMRGILYGENYVKPTYSPPRD